MTNSLQWLHYYQNNRLNRPEPRWNLPSPLKAKTQRLLAHSLSHFQLGENGDGRFLFAQAKTQISDNAAYQEALKLFIAEEQEHARFLERLVNRFGGTTIRHHWTHAAFRVARRALGFKFEIQVLVIAELVGTAYYRLLHQKTRDRVLEEVCELILKDEAQHIEFHADWLGDFQSRLLPMERAGWSLQFQILFAAAAQVAWIDHRYCLGASGANRREFFRAARRECILFLRQLDGAVAQNTERMAEMARG